MNSDDVNSFISKFACCAKQAGERHFALSYDTWGAITYNANKVWTITSSTPLAPRRLNPLGMILEGRRMKSGSKYVELEQILGLPLQCLSIGFNDGFRDSIDYTDGYSNLDFQIMFNVGRFLLKTHFGINLPWGFKKFGISLNV